MKKKMSNGCMYHVFEYLVEKQTQFAAEVKISNSWSGKWFVICISQAHFPPETSYWASKILQSYLF